MNWDAYKVWYSDDRVLYEIVKQLKGREATFIGYSTDKKKEYIFRCIKAHSIDYLKSNFNAFSFYSSNRVYNIYRSVALLKDMPMFSFNMEKRMEQQKEFNKEFTKYVQGFDFVVDFDGDDLEYDVVWQHVNIVRQLFSDGGVPFIIKTSSANGFHIEVPDFAMAGDIDEKLMFGMRLMRNVKQLFQLSSVDMSIYNLRRIFKVAYSYDIRTHKIAMPLTDKEFQEIREDKSIMDVNRAIDLVENRGLLCRDFVPEKFRKMVDDLEEEELVATIATDNRVKDGTN
jgi:hypothetical protein